METIHVKTLTLFVPDALGCTMLATPPWDALHLVDLSRWKRKVEKMIDRLRGGGFRDPLWSLQI
jgi:hypothetical protein